MGAMPFYLVFLHSIPETVILICLGLQLIGIKPSLPRVLWVALLTSLASWFIRPLPLAPGLNVFLQLPVLIGLLVFLGRVPFVDSMVASFLGLILLGLSETIYNLMVMISTGITIPQALANPVWNIVYPLPEYLILGLIIMILIKNHVVVYDLRAALEEKRMSSEEERFN